MIYWYDLVRVKFSETSHNDFHKIHLINLSPLIYSL